MRMREWRVWIPILGFLFLVIGCGQRDPEALEGRTYYLIEPGYTCQPQTSTAGPVASYKDALRFRVDGVCQTGDACNDVIACSRFKESEYQISEDLKSVQYQGRTYVYSDSSPL